MNKLEAVSESIIGAYNNGKSMKEIAVVHGCSVGTVRNLLVTKGVARRPKGRRKNASEE